MLNVNLVLHLLIHKKAQIIHLKEKHTTKKKDQQQHLIFSGKQEKIH